METTFEILGPEERKYFKSIKVFVKGIDAATITYAFRHGVALEPIPVDGHSVEVEGVSRMNIMNVYRNLKRLGEKGRTVDITVNWLRATVVFIVSGLNEKEVAFYNSHQVTVKEAGDELTLLFWGRPAMRIGRVTK